MKAKFEGKCRDCGGLVEVGEDVKWLGRGKGIRHTDVAVCNEVYGYEAERRAEIDMEMWAEHRMAGTTHAYWENRDGGW